MHGSRDVADVSYRRTRRQPPLRQSPIAAIGVATIAGA